jgi:RHS repeat-associated protein
VIYYLYANHLGSTSITTNSSGARIAELRYHPYSGTRYTSRTTPTSFRFTGQREDATIGLYPSSSPGQAFYNARYYDPALGWFVQADTIVPSLGNPQSLSRYSYCLGNPVRYRDPTGRYSEDEIMQSFGVSTWDEVLAHFRKGGSLEGRWGWLEMLRKAQDGDAVIERNPAQVRWYRGGLWPLQCETGALCGSINGTFCRNEQGEILISGRAQVRSSSKK